ncbi:MULTISPECIES: sulfurtransferase [Prauserella salsuginis group]|uniref:Sulfurtransferase n=1 Tax=Prauserella salsuginis TaxID=387889 RepID=A0ABW6G884_9PSEU|nr:MULTISPECIES: sulfurtransferase [Prauserella salsuginis group]MCR3721798.1 3-mercaptopyruvate sulfurtransferase SseA, contains two rhodanese domains [Prauserella flava]MCR3734489.1 3-mercaptopyruvate sulfurtransferase SseA, contains two rhodanese domains [Prauserella salsuginis]
MPETMPDSQSASFGPVVSTAELAAALDGPAGERPVVLDVRWRLLGPPGAESYAEGHVPGAVFVDVDTELAGTPGAAGRHPLPDPGELQRVLRAAGVRSDRPVVAYDDADSSVAARAWWLLRWAGHDRVAVLDGGFAAWQAEGRPVTTEIPAPAQGDVTVDPGHLPVLDADGAAALAREGVLLDARAHERYIGDHEPVDPRGGHIPGARNAPFAAHVEADGHWRSPEQLREHFARLGVGTAGAEPGTADPATPATGTELSNTESSNTESWGAASPGRSVSAAAASAASAMSGVGAYCGSGITASSVVLALERAGCERPAALYAGSWSNWSADPNRPAATGDEPG